jgi:hypothetical protein
MILRRRADHATSSSRAFRAAATTASNETSGFGSWLSSGRLKKRSTTAAAAAASPRGEEIDNRAFDRTSIFVDAEESEVEAAACEQPSEEETGHGGKETVHKDVTLDEDEEEIGKDCDIEEKLDVEDEQPAARLGSS